MRAARFNDAALIYVKDWTTGIRMTTRIPDTQADLLTAVKARFNRPRGKLYYLDNKGGMIDRLLVTEANYGACIECVCAESGELWLFPDDEKSPTTEPVRLEEDKKASTIVSKTTGHSSAVQAYFRTNVLARHRACDMVKCTFCRRGVSHVLSESQLEAAHILERDSKTRFGIAPETYGLFGINDHSNGILLCNACHKLFDEYAVAIDARRYLVVSCTRTSEEWRAEITQYIGKPIDIPTIAHWPSDALWGYRYERFLAAERLAGAHICVDCGTPFLERKVFVSHRNAGDCRAMPSGNVFPGDIALADESSINDSTYDSSILDTTAGSFPMEPPDKDEVKDLLEDARRHGASKGKRRKNRKGRRASRAPPSA